ncbi:MAG: hypothetical protein E5V60_15170 [Mesorhizobium sp.]|nr:hypothetical protein EN781_11230 [Mesorhizobium sp. M4A.F.Ca.ET.090.04.2.1]TIW65708.1 MAG: hypothetical protein E5V60_15170 [Mesorhizobium sp.]
MDAISFVRPRAVQRAIDMAARSPYTGRRSERSEPPPKPKKPQILDASGKAMKRPVVQGWACLYDQAFAHGGRVVYIKSGAFISTIHNSSAKRLLLDHADGLEVGSTNTGLEFANALKGLAFRMPLNGNPNAELIANTVGTDQRACVSVGIKFQDFETREIHGEQVDIVSKAELLECSLVQYGAVADTYARICDLGDSDESLWSACRSNSFILDQHVANLRTRGRRIVDGLRKLLD